MVAYLFLGLSFLAGFMLLLNWFVAADPRAVAKAIKITAIVAGVGLLLYFVVSGRWTFLPLLALALVPWFRRLRAAQAAWGTGPSAGRSSDVETKFLRMRLDHDSGEMDGTVLVGRFAGRTLGTMDLAELLALLSECAGDDEQSARVLETYLDRTQPPEWRERANWQEQSSANGSSGSRSGGVRMSRDEAYEVLGLDPGADEAAVKEAYHRLIGKIHPDTGGSTYLAAKINEAKDVLLGGS